MGLNLSWGLAYRFDQCFATEETAVCRRRHLCPGGMPAYALHGHADVGDDPYCPHGLRAERVAETDGRGYEDIDLSSGEEGRA
jgi:hypothetical protein